MSAAAVMASWLIAYGLAHMVASAEPAPLPVSAGMCYEADGDIDPSNIDADEEKLILKE